MNNLCCECGTVLYGRIDKKFCNCQCRSSYHNRKRLKDLRIVRIHNSKLIRNRSILKSYRVNDVIRKEVLQGLGFDFDFFTMVKKHSDSIICIYVYEYGYMEIDNVFVKICNHGISNLHKV